MGVQSYVRAMSHAEGVYDEGTSNGVESATGERDVEAIWDCTGVVAGMYDGLSTVGVRVGVGCMGTGVVCDEAANGERDGETSDGQTGARCRGDHDGGLAAVRSGKRTCRGLAATMNAGSSEQAGGDCVGVVAATRSGKECSSNTT